MKFIKRLLKNLAAYFQPKTEDLTYEEFINLEGKKFPNQQQKRDRTLLMRPRHW
jgi:hypothetical protein